jgi:hypothetical protein
MASSRPAKQGVREDAGSSALLDASWLLGLAIWRAQLESLCAATLRDLLLYGAAGRDRGCDLGGVPGRDDPVGPWWRWSRPPAVVSRCGPGYQIRTRVAGSSHSWSAAPTSNAL